MRCQIRSKRLAFTFFELLFAIALFGINFHIIYSQVMQAVQRMRVIKTQQELYGIVERNLREIEHIPFEQVKTKTLDLPERFRDYEISQSVVAPEKGLKRVEIELMFVPDEKSLLKLTMLKADATRSGV